MVRSKSVGSKKSRSRSHRRLINASRSRRRPVGHGINKANRDLPEFSEKKPKLGPVREENIVELMHQNNRDNANNEGAGGAGNANNEGAAGAGGRPKRAAAPRKGALSEKALANKAAAQARAQIAMVKKRVTKKRAPAMKIRTRGSLGGIGAWNNMRGALKNISPNE